jgi:hypothetical protein
MASDFSATWRCPTKRTDWFFVADQTRHKKVLTSFLSSGGMSMSASTVSPALKSTNSTRAKMVALPGILKFQAQE